MDTSELEKVKADIINLIQKFFITIPVYLIIYRIGLISKISFFQYLSKFDTFY